MYSYVSLNRKNINELLELNEKREGFNKLNNDFDEYYKNINIAKQLIARRRVKLLKIDSKVIGYIWVSRYNKSSFYINSMYIDAEENLAKGYKLLMNSLKIKSMMLYNCEKNYKNFKILSEMGFVQREGVYDMDVQLAPWRIIENISDLVFEQFEKGKHEEIRCKIQNEVFKNDSRIPLTKDDIYYDEVQSYYFEKGSILLKKNDNYIGYGQIIFSEKIPTIVNVGLLKDFRNMGYGRILMLYLLKILDEHGFKEVRLRVSTDNYAALKLYKSFGFRVNNESHMWEYKK
jgi:ribosomal protein S18 acetylase RimI-like enzyme